MTGEKSSMSQQVLTAALNFSFTLCLRAKNVKACWDYPQNNPCQNTFFWSDRTKALLRIDEED
jgi:hypothetical protein